MCVRENLDVGWESDLEELGVEVGLVGCCSCALAGRIEQVSYEVEALESDDMHLRIGKSEDELYDKENEWEGRRGILRDGAT